MREDIAGFMFKNEQIRAGRKKERDNNSWVTCIGNKKTLQILTQNVHISITRWDKIK